MVLEYIGEDLWISKLGQILVIVAFIGAAFSSLSYFFATEKKDEDWRIIGKISFRIHSLMVLSLVILLFYMLINHKYEYLYVYKHSNDIMPMKYILSCFWAGQEGSFLLWIICHVILGNILQKTAKKWEAPVMSIFTLAQAFLVSMLLGIYIPEGSGAGIFVGILLTLGVLIFYKKINYSARLPFLIGAIAIGVIISFYNIPGFTIGSNPFVLLTRDSDKLFQNEAFLNENYLPLVQGQGLNPLLQNYWMTIHPPTLFFGFASTLIPFCFAIAGLWTKKLNEWMNPTLPWIYFGVMILGTGILMGGAWAYESLTFGGFWAWDPVENASLFPWLTFVGAAHVMLVQRKRGESSYITFIMTIFSFLFVVYSTYLTRSGVLSDTSVHSFASGSKGQILAFLFFFYWISGMILLRNSLTRIAFTVFGILLAFLNATTEDTTIINIVGVILILGVFVYDYYKYFNIHSDKEEHFSSREFWMLIGAIVLMISCLQLVINTSLPVINNVFDLNQVLNKTDIVKDYTIPQMAIGTVLCAIMGFSLFLKYKKTPGKSFWKNYILIAGSSLAIVIITMLSIDFDFGNYSISYVLYPLFFWASLTTVIGNILYFIFVTKGKIKKSGASIAHLGFGLIMLGAFVSTSQSEVISKNLSDFNIAEASDGQLSNEENVKVLQGDTVQMGDYFVTYRDKYQEHVNVYYEVDYYQKENNKLVKKFTLNPFIQTNETFGKVSEPDTRHYLLNDLYTHITSASIDTAEGEIKYENVKALNLSIGKNVVYQDYTLEYDSIYNYKTIEGADSIELHINFIKDGDLISSMALPFVIYKNKPFPIPAKNKDLNLIAELSKIDPVNESFVLYVAQISPKKPDFIIMKAINFPLINMLWLGCIIMIIGTVIAVIHRIQLSKKSTIDELS
jgi:cytochrome c-type biogenesis protein CcmF